MITRSNASRDINLNPSNIVTRSMSFCGDLCRQRHKPPFLVSSLKNDGIRTNIGSAYRKGRYHHSQHQYNSTINVERLTDRK